MVRGTSQIFGPPYWKPGDFDSVSGYPRYAPDEMARRHAWLDEVAQEQDLDAVLVGGATGPLDRVVQFFTNWPPQLQNYFLYAGADDMTLYVRLWNHVPDAQLIAAVEDVRYGGDTPSDQADGLVTEILARRWRRLGLIGTVPHGDFLRLRAGTPQVEFVDLNEAYQRFRLVKSEEEMRYTRIASRMNDAAVAALREHIRPGVKEYELAQVMESVYVGHRGVNLIHFTLSTAMDSPQRCVPHQYHPDRVLEKGDVVVTEISTNFWGYAGQVLRSFTVAADPTPRYQRLFDTAEEVYNEIVDILRVGVTVGEILDAAELIDERGLAIFDDLVHGFGGAYLPPIVRTRQSRGATHPDSFAYPEGALIVVQPNVIDGDAGVQLGNSMRITSAGIEVTQKYPMGFEIGGP